MSVENWQNLWHEEYKCVPHQLEKINEIKKTAAVFNANIDAVVNITGTKLQTLVELTELNKNSLENNENLIKTPQDAVRGIVKCFISGIAEEWICENSDVYNWLSKELKYDHLQMGGQAGIIANLSALAGVRKVLVHTASHPLLQAKQFLDLDNLWAADENGRLAKASQVNRPGDKPLVHWIVEFSAGDEIVLEDKTYVCPKANRFIITYDKANLNLQINEGFLNCLQNEGFEYLLISGYHNLLSDDRGVQKIKATLPLLKKWKENNPQGIMHLELASTQDKKVRLAILESIAPAVDSIGLNEREALDALEVLEPDMFSAVKNMNLNSAILFEIMSLVKARLQVPRVQLHMLGLYMTLQNNDFKITAEQNKKGMMLAATAAAGKAQSGKLETKDSLLQAAGKKVAEKSVNELKILATYLRNPNLMSTGILDTENGKLIAVPTILVEKPKTLVGMGDTISTLSLLGAR